MDQKSYKISDYGNLYLVPTPIGNLEDITFRAINILKDVDIVFAEDTRQTKILLQHYNISKQIESCHKYSEMKNKDRILKLLFEKKNIAYVTDRGTPLISDPGNVIVDAVIENNINVIALPGPSALLPALNMSGISNEKFLFYGFLNSKKNIAKKELINLKNIEQTLIFYESPFRISETLNLMYNILGNRKIALVREISKIHENIIRGKIDEIIKKCDNIKGEIVLIVEGYKEENLDIKNYEQYVYDLIKKGYSKRDAIKEISDRYNISKNELYNQIK